MGFAKKLAVAVGLALAGALLEVPAGHAGTAFGAPGSIRATARTTDRGSGTDTFTMAWTSPGGTYLEYQVAYRTDTGTDWDPNPGAGTERWTVMTDVVRPAAGTVTVSTTITGLDSGTTYVVAVRARNRVTGAYGDWGYSGLIMPVGTPAVVGSIAETARASTHLTFGWNSATGASSYQVRYRKASETGWSPQGTAPEVSTASATIGTSAASPTLTDATYTPSASYVVQVRPKSAGGLFGRWVASAPMHRLEIHGLTAAKTQRGTVPTYVEQPALDVDVTWDPLPSSVTGVTYWVEFSFRAGDPADYYGTTGKPASWHQDWEWYSLCSNEDASDDPARGCSDPFTGTAPYLRPVWSFGAPKWTTARSVAASSCSAVCSYTFAGHTVANQTDKVRVWAATATATGPKAMFTTSPTRAPAPPLDVELRMLTGAAVELRWTRPYDRGSPITGYDIVLRKLREGDEPAATVSVNGTTGTPLSAPGVQPVRLAYKFHDLKTNRHYSATIRARNSKGAGGWAQTRGSLQLTPTAPCPLGPLTAAISGTTATLSWESAADDGGSTVTGYSVEYRKRKADTTWPETWTSHGHSGTGRTATISSLDQSGTYQFRVAAVNAHGPGGWSPYAEASALSAHDVPSFTLTAADARIDVAWTAVSGAGGYKLRVRAGSNGAWSAATGCTSLSSGATSCSLTGTHNGASLSNGTSYDVRMRTKAGGGKTASGWSAVQSATPFAVLSAPSVTAEKAHRAAILSWSAVTGADSYTVQYTSTKDSSDNWTGWQEAGSTSPCATATLGSVSTDCELSGLSNDTAYAVRMRSNAPSGSTAYVSSSYGAAQTVTPRMALNAPMLDSVTVVGTTATVNWSVRTATATGYEVEFKLGLGEWTAPSAGTCTSLGSGARTCDITGLASSSAYSVRIRATASDAIDYSNSSWSLSTFVTS